MNDLTYFGQDSFKRVEAAVDALKNGEGVIVVDDENRENEGDLIFAAEMMTEWDMALMIRYCSGIVCLCISPEKAASLELEPMVTNNTSRYQTPFTVSIEAMVGVTTGVSARDRLTTVQTAIKSEAVAADLARPGHVFPLVAQTDGVLSRRGHTEGSVDLVKLAGLNPAAVLCELTNEDGTMARLPELIEFARHKGLTLVTIDDIVQYRLSQQASLNFV